jgi:hypothetical protein
MRWRNGLDHFAGGRVAGSRSTQRRSATFGGNRRFRVIRFTAQRFVMQCAAVAVEGHDLQLRTTCFDTQRR